MNVIEKMDATDRLTFARSFMSVVWLRSKEEISKDENFFELSGVRAADPGRHLYHVFFRNTLSPVPK